MANITKREAIKSVIISSLAGVITLIITSLTAGQFPTWTEIKPALIAALGTLLAAFWNFLSTDTVKSAKADIEAAIKPGQQVIITKSTSK